MHMNELGRTGLKVSRLCLGTMTFGTPVGEAAAIEIVHWALDHGVSFIDTANPPASSAGDTIRLPEDSRARLLRRASLARDRLNEALVALVFVLTTIGMVLFLRDLGLHRLPCRWFALVAVDSIGLRPRFI